MRDKQIKKLKGMEQIILDLKPNRCDSDVYINQKMDLTNLVKYFKKNKNKGYYENIIKEKDNKIYELKEKIKLLEDKLNNKTNKNDIIDKNDNIYTISKKIKDQVDTIRNKPISKEGANSAIDILGKLPNIIRVPLIGLFKWCDKKGILPKSLEKDNLYYSSIILSNLGSIHCGAIYHNITNFGHCSSLATMGEIKKEEVIDNNGKREIRDICEFGINFDERIADGYYFAKSVRLLQYIFDNPELLEEDVSKKIDMGEIR